MNADTPASLQSLRELPLPTPVSWAPHTIGWAVIALLLALGMGCIAWALWRRHGRQRYRRIALGELECIEATLAAATDTTRRAAALAGIPALLKRTSLAAAPREQVAALTGDAWLAFLAHTRGHFDAHSGALLCLASYAPADRVAAISQADAQTLLEHARDWIAHHHVEV
jgi:Domain of unknown function (DUF4381)